VISTTIRNGLIPAVFATLGIAAIAFSSNCNALLLNSSTSTSKFKSLANNQDFVCKAADGEIKVDATVDTSTGTKLVHFLMESVPGKTQTCCEVPHDSGKTVAGCEADATDCTCGEFTLEQKVENPPSYDIPSNCLQETTTGGLETYRCVVSTGAPKEYWVWHLKKVADNTYDDFCGNNASDCSECGVAMGTTDNAKPGEYPPYGIVWQYDQYTKNGQVLLANFTGNWCHTGSFCLDDAIVCDVKSAKVSLRTTAAANFTIVEVDTVQTFNGNSTSGNVPTNFLSSTDAGTLLVDPTKIDLRSITLNDKPLTVNSSSTGSDRNGDGFNDLRTQISQASYQYALSQDSKLYPNGNCAPNPSAAIVFKGTFTDGKAWIGPTTINIVCN
jgi:hypothetical protein